MPRFLIEVPHESEAASVVELCKFGIAELDDLITRHTAG
jgi:hypothetical protein